MIGWEIGEFVGVDPQKIIYADLYDDLLADIASALDDVHRNHHVSAGARITCVRVQGRSCLNRAGYPEGRADSSHDGLAPRVESCHHRRARQMIYSMNCFRDLPGRESIPKLLGRVVFYPGIARYDMSRKGLPPVGVGIPAYRCR